MTTNFLPRELRFAWLLRDDARQGASIDDNEAQKDFEAWWVLHARQDYPAAAARVDPVQLPHLSDVVFHDPAAGDFPLTRLMRYIWRERKDVQVLYPPGSPLGLHGFLRWFFVYGVPEHRLFPYILPEQIEQLLSVASQPISPWGFGYSLLTIYTWQIRDDLRAVFPFESQNERIRYLAWYFYEGLKELGHASYWQLFPPVWLKDKHPKYPISWQELLAWIWANGDIQVDEFFSTDLCTRASEWFCQDAASRCSLQALFANDDPYRFSSLQCATKGKSRKLSSCRKFLPGVNIVGFAHGELGIGEDSRMVAAALQQASVPFAVVNVSTGPDTRQQDAVLENYLNDTAPYTVNMFCLTGMDTARVWLERGVDLFEGRINIGYWPWELPEWPAAWKESYSLVDEIWVSSRYTQEAFERSSPVPVRLMPMAVSIDRLRPLPRSAFGLPDDAFLFLYVFDFNSYLARKNPWAALRAFRKAFPQSDEPVRLVLKIMNTKADDPRWCAFAEEASQDKRILLLDGTMDRPDVLGLFAECDAYVSPHRAEGFGRTLAEAILLGKPVVATGYSGNSDFISEETGYPVHWRMVPVKAGEYPFGTGLLWADPSIDHLAWSMRVVWKNQEQARKRAEHGRRLMCSRHCARTVGSTYRQRIGELLGVTS